MAQEDEQELAAKARRGNREAFDKLVRMNKDKMFALTYRMTGEREAALDLVQDSFFAAYKEIQGFRGEASFSSWLYRIAANKTLNYLRRRKVRRLIFGEAKAAAEPSYEISTTVDGTRLNDAVRQRTAVLPPKQQLIFTLRFHDELPFGEIARMLGKSESTVKTLYQKAIEKLRVALKEYR